MLRLKFCHYRSSLESTVRLRTLRNIYVHCKYMASTLHFLESMLQFPLRYLQISGKVHGQHLIFSESRELAIPTKVLQIRGTNDVELRFPIPSTSRSNKRRGEKPRSDVRHNCFNLLWLLNLKQFQHVLEAAVKSPSSSNRSQSRQRYKLAFRSKAISCSFSNTVVS